MTWMHRRLKPALACSLLLHALLFTPGLLSPAPASTPRPVLEAHLQPPPPLQPLPEQPPLTLPEPAKAAQAPPPRQQPKPAPEKPAAAKAQPTAKPSARDWTSEVKRQLKDLDRQGKFYPPEAIAQGLQGEALVYLLIDEGGNAVAARIEQSSGHRILDDAARRAVLTLKSLPAAAPRETLLPVRFRLQ